MKNEKLSRKRKRSKGLAAVAKDDEKRTKTHQNSKKKKKKQKVRMNNSDKNNKDKPSEVESKLVPCCEKNEGASNQKGFSLKNSKGSSFLDKMREKLSGGHFRMINEKLYTCTGKEALEYFQEDPSLFDMYHAGYQTQMSNWPQQPVNVIINWLRNQSPSLVVADFGCGDAQLAKSVKNKVFSLDLVSYDRNVIACDMSNVPLVSTSVEVVVFSLSLMGINYPRFIQEAHRVLKPGGWLLIAEVKSRFDPNTGGADPNKFTKATCELGFDLISKDFSNKMFILLYFKKKDKGNSKIEIDWPLLKPCVYKRR